MRAAPSVRIAPPVCIRQSVPVFSAPPVAKEEQSRIFPLQEPNKTSSEMEAIQKSIIRRTQETETLESAFASVHAPNVMPPSVMRASPAQTTLSVCIRQIVPVCAAPAQKENPPSSPEPTKPIEEGKTEKEATQDAEVVEKLEQLEL